MSALFLSRAQLRSDAAIEAVARTLLPDESGARAYAAHQLAWSMFAGDAEAARDFLFRVESPDPRRGARSRLFVLSRRPPMDEHPILDIETKPFEPDLRAGDRLGFSLRANATRTRREADGKARHVDVVMDALYKGDKSERATARPKAIAQAGRAWLEKEAAKSGFRLGADDDDDELRLAVDGYEQWRFPGLGRDGNLSTLDFVGELEVLEPELFLVQLAQGFGRAKAFGCGLMLIRRA